MSDHLDAALVGRLDYGAHQIKRQLWQNRPPRGKAREVIDHQFDRFDTAIGQLLDCLASLFLIADLRCQVGPANRRPEAMAWLTSLAP